MSGIEGIRVIVAGNEHRACIASRVQALQAAGRHVVFVTANRPAATMRDAFAAQGIDTDAVSFIDAITLANRPPPAEIPPNMVYIRSPTMLEMIVMRIEQAISRDGVAPHLVLDHLNALQLYSGLPMLQQFSHYLVNRLRSHGATADLYVLASPEGEAIQAAISGFVDRVGEATA